MYNPSVTVIIFFCVKIVVAETYKNNVCKTFFDYYTNRDRNINCYYNPDIHLQETEMVERYGYPIQNYTVTTKDGYILTVFRIPHGKNDRKTKLGPPVFLQHGIGVSSIVFVNMGKKSLAFTLADSGFDVWLGNFRGSQHSNKHEFLNLTSDRNVYWNFTFHENGIYDLPAQLDLVYKETRQQIYYIGYSMGSTAYFIYNIEYPSIAREKIKLAISLAPIAFMGHIKTPLKDLLALWFEDVLYNFTGGAINERTPERMADREQTCLPNPFLMNICLLGGYLLYGFPRSQQNPEILPIVITQDTDAIGIKTVSHYVQLIKSKRFRQFDYGENNQDVYGSLTPPDYNFSAINVPNYFIRANNDPLATQIDVETTYASLPLQVKTSDIFLINSHDFTHIDFIAGKDVKRLVYNQIVKVLNNFH